MSNEKKYSGGCSCGKVRYHTIGDPVSLNCPEHYDTSPAYKPKSKDEPRLDGSKSK